MSGPVGGEPRESKAMMNNQSKKKKTKKKEQSAKMHLGRGKSCRM